MCLCVLDSEELPGIPYLCMAYRGENSRIDVLNMRGEMEWASIKTDCSWSVTIYQLVMSTSVSREIKITRTEAQVF